MRRAFGVAIGSPACAWEQICLPEVSRCVTLRFVFWPGRRAKYCISNDLLKTVRKPQTVQKAMLLLCNSIEIIIITNDYNSTNDGEPVSILKNIHMYSHDLSDIVAHLSVEFAMTMPNTLRR